MSTATDELGRLYEKDFYAWTRRQAKALRALARTRPNVPVDWQHLIEEVEALGRSERHAVESLLITLMGHLLKLAFSPAGEPRRGWKATVVRTRGELERRLTPTLRRHLARILPQLYGHARREIAVLLSEYGEDEAAARLPQQCPWTLKQLLDPDFWPAEDGSSPPA